ncbi:hypothetical protein GIB67_036808 [Kingdonia uniflora]|uniref:Squalene cyclase N-terminal domain-containing protein n=1 Tax=Kingdonia uniflora TaxID=39325 RepID=A0A7J7LWX0_9MAGN|nr:hypothetical protein GIB67_036808 [Kingdonia uniflora]
MLDIMFSPKHKKETLRYMYCHQNEDGGWGFHIEGHSTMFGTILNYIFMRLLGEGPEGGEDNACARAQKWIRDHGGVTSIPSWGKTWLSEDLYYPHPLIQNLIGDSLNMFAEPVLTSWPLSKLRNKTLKITMKYIHYEDENSRYFTLECVEKVEDPKSDAFKKHLARVPDYLWMAEDGMRVQSSEILGSQMRGTGFGVQTLLASNFREEITHTLKKGYDFIKQSQIIMKREQKAQHKIRYAFSDKETPPENGHGYDLMYQEEQHQETNKCQHQKIMSHMKI